MIRAYATLIAFVIAAPAFAADEKFDSEKLVGTWKLTKSKSLPPGASAVVEYLKDGTATLKVDIMGMKLEFKGKWKIDGNKLIITMKEGEKEKEDIDTITKLTADELVSKNKDGDEDTWAKVKEEKK